MTSTTIAPLGMRERKRREVRARIEDAAVFLVLRDGLEATTVDAISERADVSSRTFFNYFDSKDSALLGLHQREVTEELVAEHLARTAEGEIELVESVIALLLTVMGSPMESRPSVRDDRIEVVKRHPQVLASQFAHLSARADLIIAAIEQLVARTSPDEDQLHAEVLMGLCGSAIRAAIREWADRPSSTPVEDIEQRAARLVQQTVRTLA